MMDLKSIGSYFVNGEQIISKTISCTALAGVCGYAGTFFFTMHNPLSAAVYLATAALTSQVAYHILEKIKTFAQSQGLKHALTAVQLLQIPLMFYMFSGGPAILSGIAKLEVITATAYFVAMPVFFHLSITAWNDPTVTNIVAAMGVLFPLATGLGSYAKTLQQLI